MKTQENGQLLEIGSSAGFGSVKRYAVHPGYITSRNDGQDHYLGFMRLCELYRVAPAECVDMSQERNWRGMDVSNLIRLTPRYDGNYALPNTKITNEPPSAV